MKNRLVFAIILLIAGVILTYKGLIFEDLISPLPPPHPLWKIRSIDTMKYSRDIAREKANDSSFDLIIDQQVKNIAETGASHVAIATPYDEEFVPFLTRWVTTARKYKLKVWFRGNFSGWEKWFDHAAITRTEHLDLTKQFITSHASLFEDGDLFTPCPECENGGPGDPRLTGDVATHRQFLIDLTRVGRDTFAKLGKKVEVGYHSMNYDVAMAVMDRDTTSAVGGLVAIDHYVSSSDKMIKDIEILKAYSGGKIFLGEFGAPIPDLNGVMSEDEQADWLLRTLELLVTHQSVIGLNYWVNVGGSTELWNKDGDARKAVEVLTKYYTKLVQQQ